MRVFVTGALGFIGLNCVHDLAHRGIPVVALSRREADAESQRFLQHAENVRWVIGDIRDDAKLKRIVQEEGITHILHVAAMTASPGQEARLATSMFEVNALATLKVLEIAKEAQLERVVFVSSSGIYGPAPAWPLKKEDDPLQITGLYAICKQTSEHLCRRYSELYGLSTAVGRLGTAYGPMERSSGSRQGMSAVYNVVQQVQQLPLRVHGAAIARDFCHSQDVAQAFTALLLTPALRHHCYNVAASQAYPLQDALEALAENLPGFNWEEVEDTEHAQVVQTAANARAGMDISRLQQDTTWKPQYDLKQGVLAYWQWLQTQTR